MELALDTSSQEISIALSDKGTVISSYTWPTSHNETVELLPRITHLLEQNKVTMEKLDAVYVAHGPGSFNSLRVGLSIAKGLAYSLKIPIIGLSTLEILAYPFALTKLPIYPILRVSNDRIATAQYKNVESWQCLQQEHNYSRIIMSTNYGACCFLW